MEVVIFGDPGDGEAVGSIPSSKVLIICHTGDDICLHGDLVLEPHLTVRFFFWSFFFFLAR